MIERNELKIRLATINDAIQVSGLLKELGLNQPEKKEEILKHWERIGKNNPFYNEFKIENIYGWVMEHNEVIVGFFGCVLREYLLNSKKTPIAVASQWGVKKEYRAHTSLLSDAFFHENPISLKIVTTAIKPTGKIFEKYNGKKIPIPNLDLVYMVPLNFIKLVKHKYSNSFKKYLIVPILYLIPWRIQFLRFKKNNHLLEVDPLNFPAELEGFFQQISIMEKGVFAQRNLKTLKWFYEKGVRGLQKKTFVFKEKNKILGFVSIMEEPIENNNIIKRFKVIDLLALSSIVKKKMIKEVVYYCSDIKADVLEFHQASMITKKEIPFIVQTRQFKQFPAYYQSNDLELKNFLDNKDNWKIMPFDGDTALY